MVDLTQNSEIAVALIAGMDYARIEFKRGQIPDSPVSDCDSLNQLWYSPEIVLCQNLEEIINFANLAARDFFGRGY